MHMKGDFGRNGIFIDGAVTTTLSPFETKPLKGVVTVGIPRRILNNARPQIWLPWVVFGGAYWGIYKWSLKANLEAKRKNPKDFENDL